eukprot:23707-Pelagococcus_subviridis.AAC.2
MGEKRERARWDEKTDSLRTPIVGRTEHVERLRSAPPRPLPAARGRRPPRPLRPVPSRPVMGCAPSKERDALERDRAELSAQRRQLAMERQAWERQQRANATPA